MKNIQANAFYNLKKSSVQPLKRCNTNTNLQKYEYKPGNTLLPESLIKNLPFKAKIKLYEDEKNIDDVIVKTKPTRKSPKLKLLIFASLASIFTIIGNVIPKILTGTNENGIIIVQNNPSLLDKTIRPASPSNPVEQRPKSPSVEPREEKVFTPHGRRIVHIKYEEAPLNDLVPIEEKQLRSSTAQKWNRMKLAAQQEDINLVLLSGFRTYEYQTGLFEPIAKERGQSLDERAAVSAPPGFSEHHTGYALDVGDGNISSSHLSTTFYLTQAGQWLQQNADKYGFEFSFPQNNAQGLNAEPWHIRDKDAKVFDYARITYPNS